MKKPKILYIIIIIVCVIAIAIGIYAQFFVIDAEKNNIIMPPTFSSDDNNKEKSQEELRTQLISLFTNEFNLSTYNANNIQKIDVNKDLVYTAFHIEEQNEKYEVKIDIPVINIKEQVPVEFNTNTQNIFVNKASEILNSNSNNNNNSNTNTLENMTNQSINKVIYNVGYACFINGDILSLAIKSTLKEGENPQRVIIQTYNYNMRTKQKVKLEDVLTKKNIVQSVAQKNINEVIKKAGEEAQILVESGYTVYNRNISDKMYRLENITTWFLGVNNDLYVIFPYGNNNLTSEMDITYFE